MYDIYVCNAALQEYRNEGGEAMKNLKFILIAAIALLLGTMPAQAADGVIISQTKATVNIGDTLDLTVAGTDKIPTWTSYNANIAKVDKFGEVTALRKGKTTIRARAGSIYKTCVVTVVDSSIKLNKKNATIYHGGTSTSTVQLKATVKGASKAVTWESLNPDVAVVDTKGKVTSVSEGTATVVASANSKSASCTITVKESSISLNMENLHVSTKGTGSSIKITPTVVGSKKTVKWATSDKTVATVSGGRVTGKKTGTATITATANGVSASCNVAVTEGLISINEEKVLLYVGGTKTDTKQLKTNAAKTDMVAWISSDPGVASVDAKGLVTPVSDGTAVISVECNGKTDTCEVTVKQTATNIAEDSVLLKTKGADKTYTLNKQVVGKTSGIKWATSDKTVATVSNGKVTAKKAGTATITATANGVSDTVVVNVTDYDPTIKLNQSQYTLYTIKGNSITLKATVDGASKTVTWASSDASVATVTNKGKVTAVGAGTATISASANGVTAECTVDVYESQVILDRVSISLDKGEKQTVGYDIIGAGQSVKWASTNSKVASVSKGVVTAKNYGEADIKVTANGVTSICHVNVTDCRHQYDNGVVTTQPTCGADGARTFTCTLCGNSYLEIIPATGNHNCSYHVAVEPGCVTDGVNELKCNVCGYVVSEEVIPAYGHEWNYWFVSVPPTESTTGTRMRVCERCGEEEKEEIPCISETHVHDYEYNVQVVSPTCEKDGSTVHTCECGEFYEDEIVKAVGHDWQEWEILYEPTEKEDGLKVRLCNSCFKKQEEKIPCLGDSGKPCEHVYEQRRVLPTCTANGYIRYTCSLCGETYEEVLEAEGHPSYTEIIKEPDCANEGYVKHLCDVCGETIYYEKKYMTSHEYETVVVAEPTCQQEGLEQFKCTVCGKVAFEDVLDKVSCEYTDWETTKDPGTAPHTKRSEFGIRQRHCIWCGDTQEEMIINIDTKNSVTQVYGKFLDDEAMATLDMVNNLRASECNLKGYEWYDEYLDFASIRAAEISIKYSHNRPNGHSDYMTLPDGSQEGYGENIAGGNKTAEDVFNAWDNSPGHHANMVSEIGRYYCCGAFLANAYESPKIWWVQIFGGSRDEGDRYIGEEKEEHVPPVEDTFTIKYAVAGMEDANEYSLGDIATILDYAGGVPNGMKFTGWGLEYSDTEPTYQPGEQVKMTKSLRLVPILVKEDGSTAGGESSGSTGGFIPGAGGTVEKVEEEGSEVTTEKELAEVDTEEAEVVEAEEELTEGSEETELGDTEQTE